MISSQFKGSYMLFFSCQGHWVCPFKGITCSEASCCSVPVPTFVVLWANVPVPVSANVCVSCLKKPNHSAVNSHVSCLHVFAWQYDIINLSQRVLKSSIQLWSIDVNSQHKLALDWVYKADGLVIWCALNTEMEENCQRLFLLTVFGQPRIFKLWK